jgi:hypothetical protein
VRAVDDVQRIVDDLADRLGRSVAVEDPDLRLLASSRLFGGEDESRVQTLLDRQPDPATVEFAFSQRVRSFVVPTRIPGVPSRGISPRLCLPMRQRGELLGFVWLIDDGAITAAQEDDARRAADRLARILGRRHQVAREEAAEQEALVRELLLGDVAARTRAAGEAWELGLLTRGHRHLAVVVAPAPSPRPHDDLDAVRRGCRRVLGSEPAGTWVTAAVGDSLVAVAALTSDVGPAQSTRRAQQLRASCARDLGRDAAAGLVLGCGGTTERLVDVWTSYEQAATCARAARALARPLVHFDDLDAAATWQVLHPAAPPPHLVPGPLRDLRTTLAPDLLATLELFLERAGDIAGVAEALRVHRSTAYARLARVEELLGVSLTDGVTRLVLHSWLRTSAARPGGPGPGDGRDPAPPGTAWRT